MLVDLDLTIHNYRMTDKLRNIDDLSRNPCFAMKIEVLPTKAEDNGWEQGFNKPTIGL